MSLGPDDFVAGANAITSAMNLASKLAETRSKTTFAWLDGAREKAKRAKTSDETRQAYEEIISELTQANAEYESIARGYKELYDQVVISEEDIKFLHSTLTQVFMAVFSPLPSDSPEEAEEKAANRQNVMMILDFINSDTLRTMQLLGFNYKEAIGKPLTQICAQLIEAKFSPQSNNKSRRNK